jgi:putative ABC transport system permease protein
MSTLLRDIRYSVRTLRRDLGFTVVALLALALGIGANTAVFTVLNGVLFQPLPLPEADRLVLVSYASARGAFGRVTGLAEQQYLNFHDRMQSLEGMATYSPQIVTIPAPVEPARVQAATVVPEFFPILRTPAQIGRVFTEADGRHVAVLSDRLWRKTFGARTEVLGTPILVDGVEHTIVGVLPPGFAFPDNAQLWTPLKVEINPHLSYNRLVVGRLKPGVQRAAAQAEWETLMRTQPEFVKDARRGVVAQILPLKDLLVADVRKSLWIFGGAVAFVLLIACANIANLLLMRASARRQEMAVRRAVGATRWRLVRQVLTESAVIAVAGGALGALLAMWGVPLLLSIAPANRIPRLQEIHIDRWVLAFTAVVSAIAGLLFGLAPALQSARAVDYRTMRATSSGKLRNSLVVAEMALALVLLTGAGLMVKSFAKMRAVDPGFRPENTLTMTVDLPESVYRTGKQMQAFHTDVLGRLAVLHGVTAAGGINWRPVEHYGLRGDFGVEGRPGPRPVADKLCISPGYFQAMGIRMLAGRDISYRDNADSPGVAIISESVARRLWPAGDALGKRVAEADHPTAKDWMTIVGIVESVRQSDPTHPPEDALYEPSLQTKNTFFLGHVSFVVRTAENLDRIAPAMRAAVREVDREQPPPTVATMQSEIAASRAEPLFQTRLLSAFSLLAMLLAAVGIYGVLAYSVTERTQEIGIRMALGARAGDVLQMVLRRTLLLAAAGVVLGAAGALLVTRVLAKLLFEVKPTDSATYVAVAALLVLVAVAAGFIPARRAARVDPMTALKYE